MLIDMVRIGIEHKMKKVKFGRTAPIAKSSLGAVPIETSIFLHSKKGILVPQKYTEKKTIFVP